MSHASTPTSFLIGILAVVLAQLREGWLLHYFLPIVLVSIAIPPGAIVHHGDCIGADAEFHRLARYAHHLVSRHPPDNPSKRAFCDFDWDNIELPYLERNHQIVDSSEALIAAPSTVMEVLRSGTWATIRYAHKRRLPKILVINPDGSTNTDWSTS